MIQIPAKGVAGWDHTVIRTPGRCKNAQVSVAKDIKLSREKYKYKYKYSESLLLPRGFSRSEYSNQQSSFGQCKISFDRVLVREKLFLKNGNSYIKSDEYSWDNILRANFCRKVTFGLWPFLWSNLAIFDFDGHFHQSNGGKDRQDSAHSCPHG